MTDRADRRGSDKREEPKAKKASKRSGRKPLTGDERGAHRSQVAADQLGIPRDPATPPIEDPETIRREVWEEDRED